MFHDGAQIGFWHHGALGDFVLFTPVLDALHEVFPRVSFALWTHPKYRDLLCAKPYRVTVAAAHEPFWSALFTDQAWCSAPLPSALARCAAFFWVGQKSAQPFVERLQKRLAVSVYWVQSFPQGWPREPVNRFLIRQLRLLGLRVQERRPKISVETPCAEIVSWLASHGLLPGRYGVVHPGSGGVKKMWPMTRWQALFHATDGLGGRPTVLLLGPADEVVLPFVEAFSKRWRWPVVQSSDLKALTSLLHGAAFYLGCDSGVSHVAAAMGVPTVVVFGPTDPLVWAPPGEHVRVFQDTWDPREVFRGETNGESTVDSRLLESVKEVLIF